VPTLIDIRGECVPAVAVDRIRLDLRVTAEQRNTAYGLDASPPSVQVPVATNRRSYQSLAVLCAA
jgi:hypothetical protein